MGDPELKTQMMAEIEAALEQLLARRKPAEEITLTEIEDLVLKASQEIKASLTQMLVEDIGARQMVPGPNCEVCGKEMHYKGQREKRVITQTGEVRISRPYYYCQACKRGIFPPG